MIFICHTLEKLNFKTFSTIFINGVYNPKFIKIKVIDNEGANAANADNKLAKKMIKIKDKLKLFKFCSVLTFIKLLKRKKKINPKITKRKSCFFIFFIKEEKPPINKPEKNINKTKG